MSETKMVAAAIEALNAHPDVLAFRNNTGVARMRGFHVRYGLGNGSPDVIVVLAPWGRFIGLEGKQPKEQPEPAQVEWGAVLAAYGGDYAVFHSVAEALAAVDLVRQTLCTATPHINARAKRVSRQSGYTEPVGYIKPGPTRRVEHVGGQLVGQPQPTPVRTATPVVAQGDHHGNPDHRRT